MSDYEIERDGLRKLSALPGRFSSPGPAVMVGSVASPSGKIAVGSFMLVNPVSVLGNEVEGGSGLTAANTSVTVPVYLIGPGLPQTGEMLVCRFVDFRWVAERKRLSPTGGGTYFLSGCSCPKIPATLKVAVPTPDLSDSGYPYLRPDTMIWQTPPSDCPTATAFTGYWGQTALSYTPAGLVKPYVFRYFFRCVRGLYVLSYWYTKDSIGSPDTGFYDLFKWVAGFPGNTCTPFALTNGSNSSNPQDKNNKRVQIIGS